METIAGSIVISTLFVCVLFYYRFTQDRLNWKLIMTIITALIFGSFIIGGVFAGFSNYSLMAQNKVITPLNPQYHYMGIQSGQHETHVRYIKGEPIETGVYDSGESWGYYKTDREKYLVWYDAESKLVNGIRRFSSYTDADYPLYGVVVGGSESSILQELGNPTSRFYSDPKELEISLTLKYDESEDRPALWFTLKEDSIEYMSIKFKKIKLP